MEQRHPPQPDRGRRRSGAGVVAQYPGHERAGARDRAHRQPSRGRGHAGQCRRRRRGAGAGRRSGVGARRAGAESALPGHGRPVRLGVLDLSDTAPGRRGARAGTHRKPAPVDQRARRAHRPDRCRLRRRRRRLPRRSAGAGAGAGRAGGVAQGPGPQAPPPQQRRTPQAAGKLRGRRAQPHVPQFLRARSGLSRRPPPLRAQGRGRTRRRARARHARFAGDGLAGLRGAKEKGRENPALSSLRVSPRLSDRRPPARRPWPGTAAWRTTRTRSPPGRSGRAGGRSR